MQPSPVHRVIKRVVPFAVRDQIWRSINRVRGWNERRLLAPKVTWDTATKQDLYYCCRLLMGREPSRNELRNFGPVLKQHSMTREALVQVFLEQPEFLERQARRAAFSGFEVVDLHDFQLYIPRSSGSMGEAISQQHSYESHVTAMLRRVLQPGMTFVDVGANIGYLTMVAAIAVGSGGRVFCFEPDAERCVMLQLSIESNHYSHVELFPFAVADRVRNMIYDANAGTGTTSSLEGEFVPTPQRSLVRAVTLDATLKDEPRIDLLKMDIDGAEALALRGAQKLLKRHRPLILTEFCPSLLQQISGVEPETYCVHIVTPDPASMTLIRAAHAAKVPVMYQELGTPDFLPELSFYYDELRHVLPLCRCVAALSPRLAQGFMEKREWNLPLVLPLIVDVPATPVRRNTIEHRVRFGFAGRLEYGKGPLLLVDAFARLCHEHKLDWTLSLAGTGPQHAEVQARICFHGIEEQCHIQSLYHDSQGRNEWMQNIDVFVLPSLAEGTPNSIIEAMSHGVPTIASAVGGIPDVLDAGCGILLQANDIEELCHAMRKLGNDSGLRARMGAAACERYHTIFAPPAVLSILKGTYANLSASRDALCLFSDDHPWHPGSFA